MNYTQKSGQLTIEMCDMSVVEYMNHISRNACGIGEQHERKKKPEGHNYRYSGNHYM